MLCVAAVNLGGCLAADLVKRAQQTLSPGSSPAEQPPGPGQASGGRETPGPRVPPPSAQAPRGALTATPEVRPASAPVAKRRDGSTGDPSAASDQATRRRNPGTDGAGAPAAGPPRDARLIAGSEIASPAPRPAVAEAPAPVALASAVASQTSGYAGHSVTFSGASFGASGTVSWGDEPCVVTSWTPTKVSAYLPDQAAPGTKDLVVRAGGEQSPPIPFTVIPREFEPSRVAQDAFVFVRDKMRSPEGGVFTNFIDRDDPDPVYLYGHHQTAEHMGLILWVSAAIQDHKTFEESYQYVSKKLISPRYGIVNWGVDKFINDVALQDAVDPEDLEVGEEPPPKLRANAPLDDFRVLKGLISGWMQWKDERYFELALRISNGLLETSITAPNDFPKYPGGLVAEGCLWDEATGLIKSTIDVIPVNYADLWTMKWLSQYDPRWNPVIESHSQLMIDAQIPASGQFWNSYLRQSLTFSGDWEYRGEIREGKIKTIQSLWTAIHLARAGRTEPAQRALNFYKDRYQRLNRISEYYNPDGSDVTEPVLVEETLMRGEVRIYSQAVRLAYWLGDSAFAERVIREKIVTDQDTRPDSPTYGRLGSGADVGDAEAWESLEGLIGLLLQQGSSVLTHVYRD
jgi:hypothetical protein